MRWRVFLFISLAVNLLLAVGWWLSARPAMLRLPRLLGPAAASSDQTRTNIVVRRQFFSWREVESPDYPTYVANLRDIGCPEQTIRDIIVADVNTLYARKRAAEVVMPWRTELDGKGLAAAAEKLRALEEERRALLTRLLGPNWEDREVAAAAGAAATNRPPPVVVLDGPVLGVLPPDVRQAVLDINARSQERIQAYADAQAKAGKPLDLAELTRLRQQTRMELAKVLSPPQLDEFLLRYSQNANALRSDLGQLRYFNATPDEFRAMFRVSDQFDLQIQMLAGATDPQSMAQRKALEAQRANSLKIAIGADRYALYQSLHDGGYRDAYVAAQQAGQPDAAPVLYEISQAAAQEQTRIRADTNLTAEQRAIESKQAELEQLKAVAQALGQDLPPEPPTPSKPTPKKVHVLAAGETADFLARLYGLDPGALRAANPNLNFDKLKAGDAVSIPLNLLPPMPYLPPQ